MSIWTTWYLRTHWQKRNFSVFEDLGEDKSTLRSLQCTEKNRKTDSPTQVDIPLSPLHANYASQETVTIHGWSVSRAKAKSATSNFYFDDYLGSFSEGLTARKHVVGLIEWQTNDGFNLSKWLLSVPGFLRLTNEQPQRSGRLNLSPTPTDRTMAVYKKTGIDEFFF